MIPTSPSKTRNETVASATSIVVKADLVKITGSTTIQTITSPLMLDRDGLFVCLIPVDGAVTLGTSGNILVGIAMAQNRMVLLGFDAVVGKWYINSGV